MAYPHFPIFTVLPFFNLSKTGGGPTRLWDGEGGGSEEEKGGLWGRGSPLEMPSQPEEASQPKLFLHKPSKGAVPSRARVYFVELFFFFSILLSIAPFRSLIVGSSCARAQQIWRRTRVKEGLRRLSRHRLAPLDRSAPWIRRHPRLPRGLLQSWPRRSLSFVASSRFSWSSILPSEVCHSDRLSRHLHIRLFSLFYNESNCLFYIFQFFGMKGPRPTCPASYKYGIAMMNFSIRSEKVV